MKISILSAFPEMMQNYLGTSVLGKGIAKGKFEVEVIDIRDFAQGGYKQIDDFCYGGGGMILMPEPLRKALEQISQDKKPYVIYPSPQGVALHQELVEDFARKEHIVILCGHYEGVDERFTKKYVDLEVSLGDFVLTGGEMPAMAIVDAISRLIPGVVGRSEAVKEDSFYSGMLDHPNYTRPSKWDGEEVPKILLSGNDKAIERWRRRQSVERSLKRRPDIVGRAGIMPWLTKGAYVMKLYSSVLDEQGEKECASITEMDLHDIARACRTYGIKKYLLIAPNAQQREMAKEIITRWIEQGESECNSEPKEAFSNIKTFPSVKRAIDWVKEKEKVEPYKIATGTKSHKGAVHWLSLKREILLKDHCPLFMFQNDRGSNGEINDFADAVMTPIIGGTDGWNHLSVRSSISITLDRFFGWR